MFFGGRAVLVLLLCLLGGCEMRPAVIEARDNPVAHPPPYTVEVADAAFHRRLYVADLHADTLLQSRDPRLPGMRGHADLPRLREGGVRLQVMSIVTNMPPCLQDCGPEPNQVARLMAVQGLPATVWRTDKARALYQARKLREIAADANAGLVLLETREQLAALLHEPAATRRIGAVLGVEGAQAAGGSLAGVDELADAGIRVFGLAHFFDNDISGSAHGLTKPGLSALGRDALRRAWSRGMIVDLAHASPRAVSDVLDGYSAMPMILSHTGLRSVCQDDRNLADDTLRRIVSSGGIIGIGVWAQVLCLPANAPLADYVTRTTTTILRAVAVANEARPGRGHEYIAMGSDFDGWVEVGFDARGWPLVTAALRQAGMGDGAIRDVMGRNVCRLLLRALPGSGQAPSPALCD